MSNTKIWIHLIFSTKNREPYINSELKQKLISHIRENSKLKNIYIDFINCTLDHIHILISLAAEQSIAEVARLIKGESSHWINKNKMSKFKFSWQDEYIAASVSESIVNKVRDYIKNQEEHHKKKTFSEEFNEYLKKYGFNIN
ncbi:MAG: IS200/IS605 family transposase [Ignavibacteriae bacterium]|nr:IS200/IS605 family transposase [Ignavibacteriota bacterium]